MKKIIFTLLFLALTACGSGLSGAEPAINQPEEAVSLESPDCTTPTDGRSLGLFPQKNNKLIINGFDLPVGLEPVLRLTAVSDPPQIIDMSPMVDEEGMFSVTVTLPQTDFTRWNIRLIDGDEVLCYYIILGHEDWLESGYDGPRETDDALQQDLDQLAEDTGIPAEELARQAENEDAITELSARIQASEAETFGGLWIEWEPQYQVVLAFTQNGAETVAKYLDPDSPLYDVIDIRTVEYTEAELHAAQERLSKLLNDNGATFGYSSGVDIQNNRVLLTVPHPDIWEEFLAQNNITLPQTTVVEYAFEDVAFAPPTQLNPVPDVFMAQKKLPSIGFMEALLTANLIVENGCLFAQSPEPGDEKVLIIWEPGYFLHDDEGILKILDQNGDVVATEGELMYMGGGFGGDPQPDQLMAPIPDDCSGADYWYMGEFLPEEYRPDSDQ